MTEADIIAAALERLPPVVVCNFSDPLTYTLTDGARTWRFEFSERFGPLLVDKDGRTLDRQPTSERHPFWRPFRLWLHQGKHADESGVCWWRDVRNRVFGVRFGKRSIIVEREEIEDGALPDDAEYTLRDLSADEIRERIDATKNERSKSK